jgi:hypothetical protein
MAVFFRDVGQQKGSLSKAAHLIDPVLCSKTA